LVRVIGNGVVLSAVDHPKYWTEEKQRSFIEGLVLLFQRSSAGNTLTLPFNLLVAAIHTSLAIRCAGDSVGAQVETIDGNSEKGHA
jgi:hypothetical protein